MNAVAVSSDHAGFSLKEEIVRFLEQKKVEVLDLGTHDTRPVDYPDVAKRIGSALIEGRAEKGILICGSYEGRNFHFGVREHGMGAILSGMALHGEPHSLRGDLSYFFRLHATPRSAWRP